MKFENIMAGLFVFWLLLVGAILLTGCQSAEDRYWGQVSQELKHIK